jgi:prolyl oligopeptidase
VDNFNSDNSVIDSEGTKLYIETDLNAPNKRIVTVDVNNPSASNWLDFYSRDRERFVPSTGGGFIFANYMKDAVSVVKQYDYSGKMLREIELPGLGSAGGFSGKKKRKHCIILLITRRRELPIHLKLKKEISSISKPKVDFKSEDFESKQVFYTSKDGTKFR